MIEAQPRPDSSQLNLETLNLNMDSHSVLARFYIAATDDGARMDVVLDPKVDITLDPNSPTQQFLEDPQVYDQITWGLSKLERTSAWREVVKDHGFDYAMDQWKTQLKSSFSLAINDDRKEVIAHFTEKDSGYTDDDMQELYNRYCKDGSNVTRFVKDALELPGINFSEVEWLARKLFGRNTGSAVGKILELESSLEIDEKIAFNLLFGPNDQAKLNRINTPTGDEENILTLLKEGYLRLTPEEKSRIIAAQPTPEPSNEGAPTETDVDNEKIKPELSLIRSRRILRDTKTGERYFVEFTIQRKPTPGRNDNLTPLKLIKISDRSESEEITKRELIALLQAEDPILEPDPLENRKVTYEGEIYYLRTYFQPRETDTRYEGEYIRFFNKYEDRNEDLEFEFTIDEFDELLDDGKIELLETPIRSSMALATGSTLEQIAAQEPDGVQATEQGFDDIEAEEIKEIDDEEIEAQQRRAVIDEIDESDLPVQPSENEFAGVDEDEEPKETINTVTIEKRPSDLKQVLTGVLENTPDDLRKAEIDLPPNALYELFPLINKSWVVLEEGSLQVDLENNSIQIKDVKIQRGKIPTHVSSYDFLFLSDPKKGLTMIKEKDNQSAGIMDGELANKRIKALKGNLSHDRNSPHGWGRSFIYLKNGRLHIRFERIPTKE